MPLVKLGRLRPNIIKGPGDEVGLFLILKEMNFVTSITNGSDFDIHNDKPGSH